MSEVSTQTGAKAQDQSLPNSSSEGDDTRQAFVRLLVIIGIGVVVSVLSNTFTTVLVVSALILMIMVHELGHFATAKWSGMKVTQYFLGFGPTLWSVRRGETEYGVKAIPAGGFVKIIGMSNLEHVDPEDEPRTYRQQPFWQRAMVAFAGSFMHFVMAFLLLFALLGVFGRPAGGTTTVESVSDLSSGPSPAKAAGIRKGDKILALDEKQITAWDQVQQYLVDKTDTTVNVRVRRGSQELILPVVPVDRRTVSIPGGPVLRNPTAAGGFIGANAEPRYVRASVPDALGDAASGVGNGAVQVVQAIGQVFSPGGVKSLFAQLSDSTHEPKAVEASPPSPASNPDESGRLMSPLGLVNQANYAAEAGIRETLFLLFNINLFVGIFNLVPLLPFDGGHLAIASYEKIRSRKGRRHMVNFEKLVPLSYAVLLVLTALSLSALWLDIVNPLPSAFQ